MMITDSPFFLQLGASGFNAGALLRNITAKKRKELCDRADRLLVEFIAKIKCNGSKRGTFERSIDVFYLINGSCVIDDAIKDPMRAVRQAHDELSESSKVKPEHFFKYKCTQKQVSTTGEEQRAFFRLDLKPGDAEYFITKGTEIKEDFVRLEEERKALYKILLRYQTVPDLLNDFPVFEPYLSEDDRKPVPTPETLTQYWGI